MGRAKLKMELIEKEKSRLLTLKKRKEGLTKKLHQLTTLCDIPACMIIYDPATNSSSIWPQDSDHVHSLIDAYKAKSKDLGGVRPYGLPDFFNERQKHIEDELLKLRKKNLEARYPTWDDCLFFMDESQLRGLAAALRGKAEAVRSKIQFLKLESEAVTMMKNNMMLFNYSNLGQFYSINQDIKSATAVMDVTSVPNYYHAPPLPLPLPAPQLYMLQPNMDHNLNYYYCSSMDVNQNVNWSGGDDGDDITRYLFH